MTLDSTAGRPPRSLVGLLIAAAVQTLIVYLFVAHVALRPLDSYDGPWHLTCGRIIVETGSVPRADPLCFSSEGLDWVNLNWLAQAINYRAFLWTGFSGPLAVSALCFAVTLLFSALTLRRARCPALVSFVIFALLSAVLIWVYDTRPRAWTFALMAILYWLLDAPDPERRFGYGRALGLLALMALWNNLHGGFVYGYALLGLDALGTTVDSWRQSRRLVTRRAALLTGVIVLGLLSFALHPHGFAAPTHAAFYASRLGATLNNIIELRPINFKSPWGLAVELYLAQIFFAIFLARRRAGARDWILLLFFTHMTLVISRSMVPLLLYTLGMAGRQWSTLFERWRSSTPILGRVEDQLDFAARLAPWSLLAGALVWLTVLTPALNRPGKPGELSSRAAHRRGALPAISYLKNQGLAGRVFNEYETGGWLGWALYPERTLFIDGRGDLHARGEAYNDYVRTLQLSEGYLRFLNEQDIQIVLLASRAQLGETLVKKHGWKRLFDDRKYTVIVRPGSVPEDG